jgi:hypothetical protein
MSPQEKRHGVMARIRTSDLTIKSPTLYHLSYPDRHFFPRLLKAKSLGRELNRLLRFFFPAENSILGFFFPIKIINENKELR